MTRNTRSDYGMAFAAPNKSMREGDWINDTRKKKWTVDIDAKPPRIFILDDFSGGQEISRSAGTYNEVFEETLFEQKHGFDFAPAFKAYFYVTDAASGFAFAIGGYAAQKIYTLINSVPFGTEVYWASVDEEYFRIKRRINIGSVLSGTYTYPGSDFKFRIRVMIMNHPAIFFGGPE